MSSQKLTHGFVRKVSRSLGNCELLHIPREPFDIHKATRQHADYVAALASSGIQITSLPEEPELPDATFVEDPVIVLDEIAILCRLGAPSREPETALIQKAIERIRSVHEISAPGTLEGGDVLRIGRTLFVGASSRTNEEGIRQFEKITSPFGYRIVPVKVDNCLHLKTGVTSPAEGMIVIHPGWISLAPFQGLDIVKTPEAEPWGANTLAVNGVVLVAESAPRTAALLGNKGLRVKSVNISELQKAEAGLTCLSILFANT